MFFHSKKNKQKYAYKVLEGFNGFFPMKMAPKAVCSPTLLHGKEITIIGLLCIKGVNVIAKSRRVPKVMHNKYYKHLKKGAHPSHLGRQKMSWFLADQPVHQAKLKY